MAPDAVWFATATPVQLNRTHATAAHAALQLDPTVIAMDVGGAARSGIGAMLAALRSTRPTLVTAADVRTGRPRSTDESACGDTGAAALIGSDQDGPLLAESRGTASATEELVDRWRVPGDGWSRTWEERFGETRYVPLATDAAARACAAAGVELADVDIISVVGLHDRAVGRTAKALDAGDRLADDLGGTIGASGTPHPLLVLAAILENAAPGTTILQVVLADGADAIVWRTTDAITDWVPARPVRTQVSTGDDGLAYADFLAWRGMLTPEPPRRPEPARVSASAAARTTDWKFGCFGSQDPTSGAIHLPPARASFVGDGIDDMRPVAMSDRQATVTTFTIDRLAWSPSPPTIFAVLDFDGGGRFACEVTDCAADDLLIGAVVETLDSAGLSRDDIDAYWLGTAQSGMSGITLAGPLKLKGKPVTRVENYCSSGSEALRQAAYAVASGACDVAMAVGVEKVKDSGYQGLNAFPIPTDGTQRSLTTAAMFSLIAPAYARRYGVDIDELRRVLAMIASKNHANGAKNTRAQFRREVSADQICAMPAVAGQLTVFDCAGVADGAAAAIVVRAEDAHRYTDQPVFIKSLSFVAGNGAGVIDPDYDFTHLPECAAAATDAYAQAGITDPRSELLMAEVHDCFTPTELVLYEDLGFCDRGTAWKEVQAGAFALDSDLPVNTDGGLERFGHPVGASGLRMHFECWLQLRGQAGDRQVGNGRTRALVHNLGGYPGEMLSFVSVLGSELD